VELVGDESGDDAVRDKEGVRVLAMGFRNDTFRNFSYGEG
jgi:hypothetical protein